MIAVAELKLTLVLDQEERGGLLVLLDGTPDDHSLKVMAQNMSKGIKDEQVLGAIGTLPRHQFIDDTAFLELAYQDIAFPIPCGQTISQPYTVAFQSELLALRKGMKVLEVGTGSGYPTGTSPYKVSSVLGDVAPNQKITSYICGTNNF